MRLIELEIINFRGIRYLQLKPNGKNMVIWGPNGCGKSSVIDAVDFLLTGSISRLTGAGTGGITLAKHGHHIDCTGDQSLVRGLVQVSGHDAPIELQRQVSQPNTLVIKPESARAAIDVVQTLARRGQHVLTRREILRYVTAEGSTRAQEIQELLNITEIESIRKNLVKLSNSLTKEFRAAKAVVTQAEGNLCATLNITKFDVNSAIEFINQRRSVFGAGPIEVLSPEKLKFGIQLPPARSSTQTVNVTSVVNDIGNLKQAWRQEKRAEIASTERELRRKLELLRINPQMQRALSLRQLTDLGMSLLDESGRCPLCEAEWPAGHLYTGFQARLGSAEEAWRIQNSIEQDAKALLTRGSAIEASLERLIAVAKTADMPDVADILIPWTQRIGQWNTSLQNPLSDYPTASLDITEVDNLFASRSLLTSSTLDHLLERIQTKFPGTTPEQTAWDMLTRLEENLKALQIAQSEEQRAKQTALRAQMLLESFEQARNSVLSRLYGEIQERFAALYRSLHGEDERAFEASIEPDGAALKFEVDYRGHGKHPPHALHSEGHQDSMGLCLYFALAERLTTGVIDLVLLDDVVMSVDSGHRRELCRVLKHECKGRQFLITTHDRDWAAQLKGEGVVSTKSIVELYNWSLSAGPRVLDEPDMWNLIAQDLERNDVSSAAARLRRGSEQFYSEMCDALRANVRFHLDGRYELGELMPAAIGKYRTLIKKGKEAAQSWNKSAEMAKLAELESVIQQIYDRTEAEQWAVNANVHYNAWHRCTKEDLLPVVRAFNDLYNQFYCPQCGSRVYLVAKVKDEEAVRCSCNETGWNLVTRSKK